jgi:WD40 repeat protein
MKNDMDNHNDDVESLNISCDRKVAVSGQRGPHAALFTWDAVTGQKMQRIKVNNSKAIVACALSVDSKLIATVDGSVDHKVSVFDAATGSVLMQ